jgi:hypothetical protein
VPFRFYFLTVWYYPLRRPIFDPLQTGFAKQS